MTNDNITAPDLDSPVLLARWAEHHRVCWGPKDSRVEDGGVIVDYGWVPDEGVQMSRADRIGLRTLDVPRSARDQRKHALGQRRPRLARRVH